MEHREQGWVLDEASFQGLLDGLASEHDRLIGPTERDGAIVYASIDGIADLPRHRRSQQGPGRYRLVVDDGVGWFGWAAPAQSLKPWMWPSRVAIASAHQHDLGADTSHAGSRGAGWSIDQAPPEDGPSTAILGARACDLAGRAVLDRVLDTADPGRHHPEGRDPFVVAVACTRASESCFCASVGTGPQPTDGFDIALTELIEGGHRFVAEAGTARGRAMLDTLDAPLASDDDREQGRVAVERAATEQVRVLDPTGLPGALRAAPESPAWSAVAERCLACGNCTSVCPTCFCSNVEDHTDPGGDRAERVQVWDSCFTLGFTEMHGGHVRDSTASRYRQWLTHKLDTWHDQFGESGCVGCGRCITWCPVGIDLVAEADAVRADPGEAAVSITSVSIAPPSTGPET
jgi:sulfhydrogenase subunit beta (sulfur reductase)